MDCEPTSRHDAAAQHSEVRWHTAPTTTHGEHVAVVAEHVSPPQQKFEPVSVHEPPLGVQAPQTPALQKPLQQSEPPLHPIPVARQVLASLGGATQMLDVQTSAEQHAAAPEHAPPRGTQPASSWRCPAVC